MILIAIENIVQRKGLEALIRETDAQSKIHSIGKVNKLDELLEKLKPSLIYIHSAFIQNLSIIIMNEREVRVVRVIDHKPEVFSSDNSMFNILFLDDDEQHLIKNIKRNLALSQKQERHNKPESDLSDREQDILREIALGKTNKEIADILFISAHTVITHRKNITRKLGIKSVSGLTVYAILNKIIQMDEI